MTHDVCSGPPRPRARLAALAAVLCALAGAAPATAQGSAPVPPSSSLQAAHGAPAIELIRIPSGVGALRVVLHHLPPAGGRRATPGRVVLLVHGASFPTLLADGYRFDGRSWMDDLSQAGYDVWGLDFLGYGASDRYPQMRQPAGANPPLGRAPEAARQIDAAVRYITAQRHVDRVSVIAHSAGTMSAARWVTEHPERVDRLVLFGPVIPAHEAPDTTPPPAYTFVTEADQERRFRGYVPTGEPQVFDGDLDAWARAYMGTDSTSHTRTPASVQIPYGMLADIDAAATGHLPYDPSRITVPVLIVRGQWDRVTTDTGARWLFDALTGAPLKRDVKIDRGSHVMHLERARLQLYAEVRAFLAGGDLARRPRRVRIAAFGALTGPVRSFGENSRAALWAAADSINRAGGVRLADESRAELEVTYADGRCQAADGIALVRGFAASNALLAIGPSCSGVAEPLYHALQHHAGVAADSGLRIPVFTDGATKAGLAGISEWAFRDVPDERAMYRATWAWVRHRYPALRTVFGGEEMDFPHSHSTWANIIRAEATTAGYRVTGEAGWSITDTTFADAVRRMAAAHADVVVISAHSVTACGVLREMRRQGVHPRLVIGLTSASSDVTLRLCPDAAEGLLIPTTFAPVTRAARVAGAAIARAGGTADLHSVAAWEILFTVARAIERAGVQGEPGTVVADRRRLRDALAALERMDGVLGSIGRTPEREAEKPYVLVQARGGRWQVVK